MDYSPKQLQAGLDFIYGSASYMSIISVFDTHDTSIHLSRLARLIGRTKSTTLGHIDNLLNQMHPFIEIDGELTLNTRGSKKFYKLSEFGSQALEHQKAVFNKRFQSHAIDWSDISFEQFSNLVKQQMIGLIDTFGPEGTRNYFSLNAELNWNIESIAANQYALEAEKMYKAHSKGKKVEELDPPNISIGAFLSRSLRLKVSNTAQIEKIKQVSLQFLETLEKLRQEFETENDKNGQPEHHSGLQHVYIGLAPIFRE